MSEVSGSAAGNRVAMLLPTPWRATVRWWSSSWLQHEKTPAIDEDL